MQNTSDEVFARYDHLGALISISLSFRCCNRAATGIEFIDIMDRIDVALGNF